MRSSLLRRRVATALGIYGSTALGIVGSLVVLRVLGPTEAGRFSIVVGAAAFFQLLLELTSDEALVKYGFRYAAREDWGRFRRLVQLTFGFELVASLVAGGIVAALAPFTGDIFNGGSGLTVPMLLAALLPPLQAIESMAAAALILRSRYDIRGLFLTLSMGLRLVGLVLGTQRGVTAAVLGVLAAQIVTTASIVAVGIAALRRFPAAAPTPLGDDARPVLRFVVQSSIGTGLVSLRTWIAPLTLGIVRTATDVGLFRGAQAPQNGFAALSAPVRLILLTEQTRDWERGKPELVFAGLRRYVVGSTLLMALALAPLEWAMPWLIRVFLKPAYLPATEAARLVLGAAAIQLILGWTKSFPVTIGRPGLRILAHGVETAVLLPLIVVFGKLWGVTGAGAAVLASSVAFGLVWAVLVVRLRNGGLPRFEVTPA
ncbi:MAG TPA: oligosaccharide flippase family protein [Gaiellaceae bacterium]|jgi:O-antigen/teichoic acid export membrane protein|nr:oligosaccharide flippase family protein [Gaiellaceae bacterium]